MSVVGFQDFWVAGSRFYYQRDAIAAVEQPWVDLGVIEPVNPSIETSVLQLRDTDGGRASLVDEALQQIDESYEITCNNLNLENLSLLFTSNVPESFTQAIAADVEIQHFATLGRLVKVKDADGSLLYNLSAVAGVIKGTDGVPTAQYILTDVVRATKTITTSDDASTLVASDIIMVTGVGLADPKNAGTFTVVSATGAGPTVIVVEETPGGDADETAITGEVYDDADLLPPSEFEVESLSRGLVRFVDTGTNTVFTADGQAIIFFSKAAIAAGTRLMKPQSLTGVIQGQGILVYGRENNANQTVREFRCSINPSSANIQNADF